MKIIIMGVVTLLLIGFSTTNCSSQKGPAPVSPIATPGVPAAASAASSVSAVDKEWENALASAKKEGKVVLYGTAGSLIFAPIAKAFSSRYGMPLEAVSSTGAEMLLRLKSEHRAGLYLADIYAGGGGTIFTGGKPAGIIVPFESLLILPEVTDSKLWYDSRLPWVDNDRTMLAFVLSPVTTYVVNTDFVRPDEVKSYRNLLEPRWKGKIVLADPTIGGGGQAWFYGAGSRIMDFDYMRQLAKQEPVITRDMRLEAEWVARGKYPIAIAPAPAEITDFKKLGTPLEWVAPVEGNTVTSGMGNVSLLKNAPHKNAVRVFINWLLTKEGGTVWSKAHGFQSARMDISEELVDPVMRRQPGVKYISQNTEEFELEKMEKGIPLAVEIFGHLRK